MDNSDEERRLALEEEMSKLRCNSASPSALSTASSGSPLVRGASGSGKRPAPTSIAAAQLQCQQQQHQHQQRLEFSNRLALGAAASTKSSSAAAAKEEEASAKSLGYKLGKSVAFRAYRFNEFWSVNKLRYMNLACLLMTLICLAAILLLAGNNGAKAPEKRPQADQPAESQPLVASKQQELAERDYGEREVEETTASSQADGDPINRLESLVEPIVSQLFDLELGGLHGLLRRNLSRPLVRRTKNGATITISSSSSSANDSSLLERLLPRLKAPGDNSTGNLAATATITFGAEPMFASSNSPPRISSAFSPLEALFGPPMLSAPFMSRHRRLLMEPQQHQQHRFMGGPFAGPSIWGPPPPLMPPPGLLGMMMMRAQQDQQDQPEAFEWPAREQAVNRTHQEPTTSQASGAGNSTVAVNTTKSAGSGPQPQEPQSEGSENEFEVVAPSSRRLQSLYSRSRSGSPGGSMLIFSSGPMDAGDLPPFAGPFAGLLPPPPPPPPSPHSAAPPAHQVMLLGGEGSREPNLMMSPLIRGLLSNVMGDLMPGAELVPATSAAHNRSATNSTVDRLAKASARVAAWMSPGASSDPDDDWAPLNTEAGAWDEKEAKQLRARHRSSQQPDSSSSSLNDELDDGPAASFLAGLQLAEQPTPGSESPITTRNFRRLDMVPAGIKSQSLSRADNNNDEEEGLGRRAHVGRMAAFLRAPQNDRRLDEDQLGPAELPPFGFIGKLLSDLSPLSPSHRHEHHHRHTSSSSRSRSLDLDDLDEGDSSQSEQSQEPAAALLRPLRVASARIRMMRPTIMNQAGEPSPFLPAHFSVSAEPNGGPEEKEQSAREEQPTTNRLDDNALNSAEDRIRLTLNQIYQQSPEPQQQQQQQKAFVLGPVPRGANIPIPLVQQQQQVKKGELTTAGKDGNPFTSPSSPLFGFPANSQPAAAVEPQKAAATAAKLVVVAPAAPQNQQTAGASNRQQRSFTYHSNNEIAAPFQAAAGQQKPPAANQHHHHHHHHHQQQQETLARSRFVAPLTPPPPPPGFMGPAVGAAGIMGRRLDDLNEAGLHPHAGRANY